MATSVLMSAVQLGETGSGRSSATAGPAKPHALANGSASHAGGDDGPAPKRQRTEGSGGGAAAASIGDARMLDPLTAPPPDLLMEEVADAADGHGGLPEDAPDAEMGAGDLLKVRLMSYCLLCYCWVCPKRHLVMGSRARHPLPYPSRDQQALPPFRGVQRGLLCGMVTRAGCDAGS